MDEKDRERMEELAIQSAISEALTVNGARSTKVLAPHVRAACRVSWVAGLPIVAATKNGTDEISVTSFVSEMKHDPDFMLNFHKPPDPKRPDEDGVRRISVLDQKNLNAYAHEIADGRAEVMWPEETKRKLDEDQIDIRDQASLNDSLEKIASGEKSVVFSK